MDSKKIWAMAVFALLLVTLALASPYALPPANHTMHDVQEKEQRNATPGGSGMPGGTNEYFPTYFPMPSPTVRR